jgi:hypothetical protein
MNEKQTQQHRQHFNLSDSAKHMLEQLTAQRYPGKQRRQSQVVEDLIVEAFTKEQAISATTGEQGVEIAKASMHASDAYNATDTSDRAERSDTPANVRSMMGKRAFSAMTSMKAVAEARSPYGGYSVPAQTNTGRCASCKHEVQEDWKYCIYCGNPLAHICSQCGAPRLDFKDALFCFECGNFLE